MDTRPMDEALVRSIADRVQRRFMDIYRRDDGGTRIKQTTDTDWIRKHGTNQADLAKLSYDELPDDWKYERRSRAGVAAATASQALTDGNPLDDAFIEYAADIVHEEWLRRNLGRAKVEHRLPYSELTEGAKEKDRIFVEAAIEILQGPKDCVFLDPITWPEIFNVWRDGEAGQESWKRHWEERGFDSWDEWRTAYIAPYRPETLDWTLYRIPDPVSTTPDFFGVPADAWIRNAYDQQTTGRLRDIINLPIVTDNAKIAAIRENFPQETMLTGVIHDGRIILLEGMHRACALATWNPETPFVADVSIALAEWPEAELRRIGGNHKR